MAQNPWDKHPLRPKQIQGYVTKEGNVVDPHEHKYPHAEKPPKSAPKTKKAEEEGESKGRLKPKQEHEKEAVKPETEMSPKKEKVTPKGSTEAKEKLACALGV